MRTAAAAIELVGGSFFGSRVYACSRGATFKRAVGETAMHIWSGVRVGVAVAACLSAAVAGAQDAGMMAAQQAQQSSMQAMQMNEQASQLAQQNASQGITQAQTNATIAQQASGAHPTPKPQFSVKAGRYNAPVMVQMKARSRSAVMYYSTDGWTPTTASLRYDGPIEITQTTHLQAMTISPGFTRSAIAEAVYTLPGRTAAERESPAMTRTGGGAVELPEGMAVPLVFAAAVSSKTARIGDRIPLLLGRDLRIDGVLVAAKGARAWGKVILADRAMRFGLPGVVQFTVDRLELEGAGVPLRGTEELDGVSHENKAQLIGIAPFGDQFVRGRDAEIPVGARVTAHVAKGTSVDVAALR